MFQVDKRRARELVGFNTLNPDGCENHNIRCIQADRMAAQTKEELSGQTALLIQDQDDNESFAECGDDEELETNETVRT